VIASISSEGVGLWRCLLVVSVLGLSACAGQPKTFSSKEHGVWQWRQQQLGELNQWTFNGRVAVRDAQADGWNASLSWRQKDEHYDIKLSGALGQGGVRIHGNGGQAVMEAADQPPQMAESPEALMQAQLGWYVPVRSFKYWLKGQPGPQAYERDVDHLGRLARLQQDGWEITYKRYARVNGIELPRKLELSNHRLRVRLVIDQWRLHTKEDT